MSTAEGVGGAAPTAGAATEDDPSGMRGQRSHVVDHDGSIWSSYGVFAQPAYAFIDDSGSVEVFVGALGEKALVKRMNALAEA